MARVPPSDLVTEQEPGYMSPADKVKLDTTDVPPRVVSGIIQLSSIPSFPAHPVALTVKFDIPFLDDQYALVAQLGGGNGDYKPLRYFQKTAEGFVLVVKADSATAVPDFIDFHCQEAILEQFSGYSGQHYVPHAGDFIVTVGTPPILTVPSTLNLIADYTGHPYSAVDYDYNTGCTAYDLIDGDLTASIVNDSAGIDKLSEGDNWVHYSVTNSAGLTATGSAHVYLDPPPPPREVSTVPRIVWAQNFGRPDFDGKYVIGAWRHIYPGGVSYFLPIFIKEGASNYTLYLRFLNGHFQWWFNDGGGRVYHRDPFYADDWPIGGGWNPPDGGHVENTIYQMIGFPLMPNGNDPNGVYNAAGRTLGANVYFAGPFGYFLDNVAQGAGVFYWTNLVGGPGGDFHSVGPFPTGQWIEDWDGLPCAGSALPVEP